MRGLLSTPCQEVKVFIYIASCLYFVGSWMWTT